MFGFVKPFVPLMRVSEHEFYRGAYCGLCHAMNRFTGVASSTTLSYDMVFFALVRGALMKDKYVVLKKRCPIHPFKKRTMMMRNPSLEYTARINAVLVYYKLKDDISDEHGLKKTAAGVLSPVAAGIKRRACAPDEVEVGVCRYLSELSVLEKEKCASPDEVAELFGKTLALCLSYGLEKKEERIANEVGRHIGRAVYLADAACDWRKDKKSGAYNPFLLSFDGNIGEKEERIMKDAVLLELSSLCSALELIDYTDFDLTRECVMNVAVYGIKNAFITEFEKERLNDKSIHGARS
ncbi:MAG: DUF5685 family protein [Eubacteriales bacterium]